MIGGEIDALLAMRIAVARQAPRTRAARTHFGASATVITVHDERQWGCGLPQVGSSPGKR
jgi:hypothetical protein